MDNYTCSKCNKEIPNSEESYHALVCNNTIRQEEYADLVSCEICNLYVPFSEYTEHTDACLQSINNYNNNYTNILNNLLHLPIFNNGNIGATLSTILSPIIEENLTFSELS